MTFLEGQSRVLELVATSAPLTDVLLLMTQLIEAEAPGLLCGVVLVDEGGTHFHSGVGPSLAELMCALEGMSIDPPLEPCGTAVYTRGVVVVPHIDSDHRWSPQFRDLAQRHSLQYCLCMPMLGRQGQVLGSIAMYRRLPGDATPSDHAIAQAASHLVSIAIERQRADLALVDTGRKLAAQVQAQGRAQAHDVTATQLAKIIELAPAFMAVFRGPTFIIEMANDAYRQLVGHRELVGLPVRQAFPEVSGQGFFELVEHVYVSGEPWVGRGVPVVLSRQAGAPPQTRWIDLVYQALRDADGSINGVFAHGVDITERKLAEEALREAAIQAEQRSRLFDTTLSAMTEFGFTLDSDGRLIYVNKALLDLWGLPLEQVVGKNFFEIGYPDALAGKLQRQIIEVFESRCEISDETPYITQTGTEGHYEYILRPVVGDQGKVNQVAGSGREITARKRAQDALKDADRRKSEFLAILAHELRNPLAPIRNALQILRRSDGKRENAQPIFEMMERQIAQMVRLVDDLLDVSRISRGTIELRLERVELTTIVRQAVETMQPILVNMDHELTITSPAETIHVRADPARLIQILDNLLHNACKFTERGGRIRLTIEPDGDQAVIRVEDNGVGIAAENLEHVFGMFTQIDQSLERSSSGQGLGLGLGLTLVKTLVEMHGGSVEARSGGVGRGAEFVVRMKRLAELSVPPKVSVAAQPPESAPLRILVVDDNADAADSMAFLLELDGHEARIARDGLHAVDAAAHWTPEVVLLDIGLPKLDGYEVARRIRAQRHGVNGVMLIAITGWGQDDDRRRSRDAGFDAHLTKPVDYVDLKKLLVQWRGGQES
jgi:PAS domain S-box-containing protein